MKNKQSRFSFLLFLVFVFVTSGCFRSKKKEQQNLLVQKQVEKYIFDLSAGAISRHNIENTRKSIKAYFPEQLVNLLCRRKFTQNGNLYIVETLFPEYEGEIDTLSIADIYDDSADWLESLIVQLEEERIAGEIAMMDNEEENPAEENVVTTEQLEDEINRVLNNEIEEKLITDKNDSLKFMEYENEIFIPQKTKDGYEIIHSDGNDTIRNFYDDEFRLIKQEKWNILSVEKAEKIQSVSYVYDDETRSIIQKTMEQKDNQSVYQYNADGLVTSVLKYQLTEDNKYLISKKIVEYNSDNKIKSDEEISYEYNKDYSKRTNTFSKKYIYSYNEDEIPADFEYFEDGQLKMRNKYSSEKGTYTSQIFFENNLSVKTYYENNERVKEIYLNKDEVIRTKNYENEKTDSKS